jgi:hypothetical protein
MAARFADDAGKRSFDGSTITTQAPFAGTLLQQALSI